MAIKKTKSTFPYQPPNIKKTGIWAFIVQESTNPQQSKFMEKPKGKDGLVNYQHSRKHLLELIQHNGFSLLKRIEFVAEHFQMEGKAVSFQLYVAEKRESGWDSPSLGEPSRASRHTAHVPRRSG